jgi:hypothetical protein
MNTNKILLLFVFIRVHSWQKSLKLFYPNATTAALTGLSPIGISVNNGLG